MKDYIDPQLEQDEEEADGDLGDPVFGFDFDEYDDPADWFPPADYDPY